jgi:predicted ATPase
MATPAVASSRATEHDRRVLGEAQVPLLAFDEPEKHLHPALLGRVMSLLVDVGDSCQVVLATHSDRVLELLDEPAKSVRVCSLDGGRVSVDSLDPAKLEGWLKDYGDLAELRRSGHLGRALAGDDEVAAS